MLIAFRIALPYIVLRIVNQKLTEIKDYRGHVNDIDIALIRGAYKIEGLDLKKTSGKIPVPFFAIDVIDLSVEWKQLFKGAVVGEIVGIRPVINFVKGPTEATSQTKIDKSWVDVVDELMPLKLNRVEIQNGEVHYRDYHSTPKVDIVATRLNALAENLSNTNNDRNALPSPITASAAVYNGEMKFNMKLNALNAQPTFDMNAELTTLDLVKLNDFLRAYGNFDVQKGRISIYTEAAAKDGRIKGYAKPIIKDMKVVDWKKEEESLGRKVWESIVEVAAWILKNKRKEQIATRIEFEGQIKDPDVNVLYIVLQTLRNAFIQALYPSLENSVSINTIKKDDEKSKTFLGKLFKKTGRDVKTDDKKSNRKKDKEKK